MITTPQDGQPPDSEHTAQELHTAVLENMAAAVLVLDLQGQIVYANPACLQFSGYTAADLLGWPLWEMLLEGEDAAIMQAAFRWLTADWFPNSSDFTWKLPGSRQRMVHMTNTAICYEDGSLHYVVSYCTDVTERRAAAVRQQQRQQNYWDMVQQMAAGLAMQDASGIIIYANDYFCRLLGYTREEVIGLSEEDLVHPQDLAVLREQIERRTSGEHGFYELKLRSRDGDRVYVLVTASPIYSAEGAYNGSFALLVDIGAYKAAEQALRESNAELDAFAHTVAHDLKDPIFVLTGFASMVEREFIRMSDSELKDYLQTISRTGDKMINIINELLLLASMRHTDTVAMEPLNTAAIVEEARKRLYFMIEQYGAEIVTPQEDWPPALGYAPWVEEVWVNYISNAIKYGGQPPRVEVGATPQMDGTVRFWVRDNGRGIPTDKRAQIFTPFTRLDQVRAQGHGLGLSIVQRIIQKLGGKVGLESEIGEGSTFSFTLPGSEG